MKLPSRKRLSSRYIFAVAIILPTAAYLLQWLTPSRSFFEIGSTAIWITYMLLAATMESRPLEFMLIGMLVGALPECRTIADFVSQVIAGGIAGLALGIMRDANVKSWERHQTRLSRSGCQHEPIVVRQIR